MEILRRSPAVHMVCSRHDPRDVGFSGSRRTVRFSPAIKFADEGHVRYYASPVKMVLEKEKEKNKIELMKDLEDVFLNRFTIAGDTEKKRFNDAMGVLHEQIRQERKETMKKRKKDLKAAKKAAKIRARQISMKECADEDSSSSSSSESSGDECSGKMVVDMSSRETGVTTEEPKPEMQSAKLKGCTNEDSSCSSESSDSECERNVVVDLGSRRTQTPLMQPKKLVPSEATLCTLLPLSPQAEASACSLLPLQVDETRLTQKLDNDCGSSGATSCCSKASSTIVLVEKHEDKIEVCMGGKCKKSGAMELLAEFEKKVGIEGAVVGCKCMGKCKEGPNVRVRNNSTDSSLSVKNPLCIGVGLDDVGMIVANFFGENKEGNLAAI